MPTKPIMLNLEKDYLFEESKNLQILLSTKVINHDQVIEDLRKCEATHQIFQDVF